jgi:hypothetical protein
MKSSNDIIGNRTRNLPICSAVPQPTVLPRAPHKGMYNINLKYFVVAELKFFFVPSVYDVNILIIRII